MLLYLIESSDGKHLRRHVDLESIYAITHPREDDLDYGFMVYFRLADKPMYIGYSCPTEADMKDIDGVHAALLAAWKTLGEPNESSQN